MGEHVSVTVKQALPHGGYRVFVREEGRLRELEVSKVRINGRTVETAGLEIDADDYRLSDDGETLDVAVGAPGHWRTDVA